MDAFKRIDEEIPCTGSITLRYAYIWQISNDEGKEEEEEKIVPFSLARHAIIFMACAHLRFSHAHTSNQNYHRRR